MDIDGRTIWQIAAGDGKNKHYAKQCLQEKAVFIGPGHRGPWPECEMPLRAEGVSTRRIGIIKKFAEELRARDIVVLRVGTQQVYGVGELVGTYDWSERFSNVQGWDLQHSWRVNWLWHQDGKAETFPVYALNLGNSVQKLSSSTIRQWLEGLEVSYEH